MEPILSSFAQMLHTNLDDPNNTAFATIEDLDRWCAEQGYALVKLPEPQIDEFGDETWPVESKDVGARVKARRSDGRLMMDSVSHPFATREHALSLAAALIAAAKRPAA